MSHLGATQAALRSMVKAAVSFFLGLKPSIPAMAFTGKNTVDSLRVLPAVSCEPHQRPTGYTTGLRRHGRKKTYVRWGRILRNARKFGREKSPGEYLVPLAFDPQLLIGG